MGEQDKIIKAYKGFNPDMTCRGFQYKVGQEYHTDKAELCATGFHACEHPLECLSYYLPIIGSVYHEVEQGGNISRAEDSYYTKAASTKIKIGKRLSVVDLVKAAVEYVRRFHRDRYQSDTSVAINTLRYGVASGTEAESVAVSSGAFGVAVSECASGVAVNRGASGGALSCEMYGVAVTVAEDAVAAAEGVFGTAVAAGGGCTASAARDGVAVAIGHSAMAIADSHSAIAVAWGADRRAKGVIGAHLLLSEWGWGHNKTTNKYDYNIIGIAVVEVDGVNIKPDTYYGLKDGKVVEAKW